MVSSVLAPYVGKMAAHKTLNARAKIVGAMMASAVCGSPGSLNLGGPNFLLETEARG